MSERNAQLKAALAALSFEDREDVLAYLNGLQEDLSQLSPDEFEDQLIEELDRRVADAKAGVTTSMPAAEFMKLMREKHR